MAIPTLVTGDDITLPVTLKKKGLTFVIDAGATIVARLVSADRESVYTPEIAQTTAAVGADLANSLIILTFASADTALVTHQGSALLEIQVDDGGKLTWFTSVRIVRGQIG